MPKPTDLPGPDQTLVKFKAYVKEHVGSYKVFPQGRHVIKESEFIDSIPLWEETIGEELSARQEHKLFNWMKINNYFKPE
jgi:hypothetical protein